MDAGGDLVSILSQSQQDQIVSQITDAVWIGFNDRTTEGTRLNLAGLLVT